MESLIEASASWRKSWDEADMKTADNAKGNTNCLAGRAQPNHAPIAITVAAQSDGHAAKTAAKERSAEAEN
jgi:hypothetical protein